MNSIVQFPVKFIPTEIGLNLFLTLFQDAKLPPPPSPLPDPQLYLKTKTKPRILFEEDGQGKLHSVYISLLGCVLVLHQDLEL